MKKITLKKSAAAAAAAVMMIAGVPAVGASAASSTTYSAKYPYYNAYTHLYYDTYDNMIAASAYHYGYNYYYYNGAYSTVYTSSYPYFSSYTNRYYRTYEDAIAASGGYSKYVTNMGVNTNYGKVVYSNSYSTNYPYYSTVTKQYYANYSDAVYASGNRNDCVYFYPNSNYYYNYYSPYYYDYGYYPYSYYYGYGYYPYSYKTYSTKYVKNTSSVAAADGMPYEYGNNKFWGWTNLSDYISRLPLKSTYAIEMNGASIVPTEVLKAARLREVTLQLVLDNGVIWTIDSDNISSTDEVDLNVVYDTNGVPAELVSAAKKTGAVSVAQIKIGAYNDKSLGLTGNVSVKFSSKRADCFVKVYLYDEAEGNLKLVDKTIIDSKGRAKFNAKYSGNYLLVLS